MLPLCDKMTSPPSLQNAVQLLMQTHITVLHNLRLWANNICKYPSAARPMHTSLDIAPDWSVLFTRILSRCSSVSHLKHPIIANSPMNHLIVVLGKSSIFLAY